MRARPPAASAPIVLIADDVRDTGEMYGLYLAMLGYRFEMDEDGHEAVRKAHRFRPAVIVMDLAMPRLDGWTAIRTLQAEATTATIR